RFISHDDNGSVPFHVVKAPKYRSAKAVLALILDRNDVRETLLQILQDCPGPVGAAIVHDDNLMRHVPETQLKCQVFDRGGDARLFVARRNYDAEEFKLGCGSIWSHQRCAGI